MAEINVVIQAGDPLPKARILAAGGIPPLLFNFAWNVEPVSSDIAEPQRTFAIVVVGNEITITSDAACVPGNIYVGILRSTITDANSNTLIRDLPVTVEIEQVA